MLSILTEEFTSNDNSQNYKKTLLSQNIKTTPENFTSLYSKNIFNNSELPEALIEVSNFEPTDTKNKLLIGCGKSDCVWCMLPTLMSSIRHTPRQRDLQPLDLRTHNIEEGKQLQHEQYSNNDAHLPITSRSIAYKEMQQPRPQSAKFGKAVSACAALLQSSEQSMNQGLSRSWSMIDMSTPRAKPLRLRAGYDHFSCEEEEVNKFYQSIDPSVDYNELEPEPPRPTKRQTARLRAGAPNNSSYPPPSPNVCPDSYRRQADQNSQLQNFSSFCPPGTMSGAGPGAPSNLYSQSPRRRSSFDQYSSIPARQPSTIGPPMTPWSMPMAQTSPMRQSSRPSTSTRYSQDASSALYESPRRNQYPPHSVTMSSTRYNGLPGQPLRIPGLTPQTMTTQWMTPPGKMPSSFGQQSSIGQPRQSHWEPSSCPPDIQRPLMCPKKDEGDVCPKDYVNIPCEGCENNKEQFAAPLRCKPLDPDILRKLSCDLPSFKIPHDMEDDFICIKRREQWETLVKDHNCPGAIQSTIDGLVNFNALAFDIFFGETRLPDCLPGLEPITLLEAFYTRVNYERCQVKKLEQSTFAKDNPDDDEHKIPPPNDDCSIIEKCFKRKYQTELNAAIEMLLKAEKGFDFQNPNPELPSMNMILDKTSTDLPGVPIFIQAFTGTTKPRN